MSKKEKIFVIIFCSIVVIAVIGFVGWSYHSNNKNNYIYKNSSSEKSSTERKDKTTSTSTSTSTNKKDEEKELTLTAKYRKLYSYETYKTMCKSIAYRDLSRTPDNYYSENIYFKGKVIQTKEDSKDNMAILRVNTKLSNYIYSDNDYIDDTVMVFLYEYDKNYRILEDDIIEIWGISSGIYTYESVIGSEISIPSMIGVYWDLK